MQVYVTPVQLSKYNNNIPDLCKVQLQRDSNTLHVGVQTNKGILQGGRYIIEK